MNPILKILKQLYNILFQGRAAGWTAIFTCALVGFSGLLWKVASDANRTSLQTQRAFVNYSGLAILQDTTGADKKVLKGIRITINWINSGTTPTKDAITQANVAVTSDTAAHSNFETLPQSERVVLVVGPKALTQPKPVDLSLADIESISQGVKHAFAWGWIAYYDIFPDTPMRLTEYCTQIEHPMWSKKDHRDASGSLSFDTPPCPVHNCYDENCSDYQTKKQQLAASFRHR